MINRERNERTIFTKSSKQKITESELLQIFQKYGTISKVKFISGYSALIEFINKASVNTIMNNKNKIFFKGNKLQIEKASKIIPKIFVLKKRKTCKNEIQDNHKISNFVVPKEKNDEKFIPIEIKEGKSENSDKFTLFEGKHRYITKENRQLKEENIKIDNEINKLKEGKIKIDKKIDDLKISLNLMAKIDEQRDIYYQSKIDDLNKKMRLIQNYHNLLLMLE